MLKSLVPKLLCPVCRSGAPLTTHVFTEGDRDRVRDGALVCGACRAWYPVEDGLLELVVPPLLDLQDLERFQSRFRRQLDDLHLAMPGSNSSAAGDTDMQLKQRHHFDWYAENEDQDYCAYQRTPFWLAADAEAYARWLPRVAATDWILDVGCADGRSAFPFVKRCTVVGFDISKKMIRKAIERARAEGVEGSTTFLVADANGLPFCDRSFDFTLCYGVLHHLPDPKRGLKEILRVLKDGGAHFGSENNESVFRAIFDLMMKVIPLWVEEAGAEPLISRKMIWDWTDGEPVRIKWRTSVFLPPHLFNLLGDRMARLALSATDRMGQILPALKGQGGLIVFEIAKDAREGAATRN